MQYCNFLATCKFFFHSVCVLWWLEFYIEKVRWIFFAQLWKSDLWSLSCPLRSLKYFVWDGDGRSVLVSEKQYDNLVVAYSTHFWRPNIFAWKSSLKRDWKRSRFSGHADDIQCHRFDILLVCLYLSGVNAESTCVDSRVVKNHGRFSAKFERRTSWKSI